MNYFFYPEAEKELIEAVDYYEEIRQNLGRDFALEVKLGIERIILFPEAWPEIAQGIRRSLLKRFPYGLLYHREEDSIYILALMNLYKEPGYWKNRTK